MSKPLAASKKVMQSYLSELLTDDDVPAAQLKHKEPDHQPLEKLLEKVSVETKPLIKEPILSRKTDAKSVDHKKVDKVPIKSQVEIPQVDSVISTRKSQGAFNTKKEKRYREGPFQAMFFDVSGLTVAVPLIELGGIHNMEKSTSLMGKPDWFKGVMVHREQQINVVDTARWVMPEKCDENLISNLAYQYVIMLSTSVWGLAAEHLVDTVTLNQEDVKWLDEPSKRPWLAGLVKDRMCALLDVEALIKLLDEGSGIHQN